MLDNHVTCSQTDEHAKSRRLLTTTHDHIQKQVTVGANKSHPRPMRRYVMLLTYTIVGARREHDSG